MKLQNTHTIPEAVYETLSTSCMDVIVILDANGVVEWVSPSSEPMMGWKPDELIGLPGFSLLHPEELPRAASVLEAVGQGFAPRSTARYRIRLPGGGYDECEMSVQKLSTGTGLWIRLATDQFVLQRTLAGAMSEEPTTLVLEDLLGLLFRRHHASACTISFLDDDGQLVAAGSPLPPELAGLEAAPGSPWAVARDAHSPVLAEGLDELDPALAERAEKEGLGALWVVPVVNAAGQWLASLTIWTFTDGPSPRLYTYATQLAQQLVEVVIQARDQRNALEAAANRDPLTGLFNRRAMAEQIAQQIADVSSTHSVGLLYLDLDHFKPVNDTHGHAVGDRVLAAVAKRIIAAVRPDDAVGRFGGDEFVVLCRDIDREALGTIAERIRERVTRQLRLEGVELQVGASIGIAIGTQADRRLLEAADTALYRAKRSGRGRVCWAG